MNQNQIVNSVWFKINREMVHMYNLILVQLTGIRRRFLCVHPRGLGLSDIIGAKLRAPLEPPSTIFSLMCRGLNGETWLIFDPWWINGDPVWCRESPPSRMDASLVAIPGMGFLKLFHVHYNAANGQKIGKKYFTSGKTPEELYKWNNSWGTLQVE